MCILSEVYYLVHEETESSWAHNIYYIQDESQLCYFAYYLYDVYNYTDSTMHGDDVYYALRRPQSDWGVSLLMVSLHHPLASREDPTQTLVISI
jgi:CRISPR/Cas system-associated endonuclease/helicase Cas3